VLDLDLGEPPELPPLAPSAAQAAQPDAGPQTLQPLDFDFGSVSLDLDSTPAPLPGPPPAAPAGVPPPSTGLPSDWGAAGPGGESAAPSQTSDFQLPDTPSSIEAATPLERKIELAEEFQQIGDREGARELLLEVIEQADGPLKARAQALLGTLG
jgi:pilus assembly protein FimV